MNPAELNNRIIGMMKPADRKALGLVTQEEVTTKTETKLEKVLQSQCENYLRQHDIEFLHLSYRAREKVGQADLTFCIRGRYCSVELKSATGKVSMEQVRVMNRLKQNGAKVAVIRTFEEFVAFVKQEQKGK
jgi:hypothetical protein